MPFMLNARTGCYPDVATRQGENLCDHSAGDGCAFCSGNGDDGNAAGSTCRKEMIDHRTRHVAWFPYSWL
jgi:hypothetical protein